MSAQDKNEVAEFTAHLEEIWGHLDKIFAGLEAEDWEKPHGADWKFADVPFHLAYLDRVLINTALTAGSGLDPDERLELHSDQELNAWNDAQLAGRPAGQSVQTSLEQMQAERAVSRQALAAMTDADLDEPAWWAAPPFTGWRTIRFVLSSSLLHGFNHLMEMRLRLGIEADRPSPALVHRYLSILMYVFPAYVNPQAAARQNFQMVFDFSGPGGGTWALRVTDGEVRTFEGHPPGVELVITQSPETLLATSFGIIEPQEASRSGKMQVSDYHALVTYGQLTTPMPVDYVRPPVELAK